MRHVAASRPAATPSSASSAEPNARRPPIDGTSATSHALVDAPIPITMAYSHAMRRRGSLALCGAPGIPTPEQRHRRRIGESDLLNARYEVAQRIGALRGDSPQNATPVLGHARRGRLG